MTHSTPSATTYRPATSTGDPVTPARSRYLLIVVAVAVAAVPLLTDTYTAMTAGKIVIYALFAVSLMLVMGIAGMPSLGHAALFGAGGYTAGLVAIHTTTNIFAMLLAAVLGGAAFAALTGWMLVRGNPSYLIMVTLAIGELLAQGVVSWVSVTGGSDGLANIPRPTGALGLDMGEASHRYWFALAIAAIVIYLVSRLLRAPLGRTLRAIRDNEPRMRGLGYRTKLYRYAIYIAAGGIAGIAGCLWITQTNYISPADMGFHASSIVLLAVCVGGLTSIWGTMCGAALIILVQDYLPSVLQGYGPLVLGLMLIITIYFIPGGIAGVLRRARRRVSRRPA